MGLNPTFFLNPVYRRQWQRRPPKGFVDHASFRKIRKNFKTTCTIEIIELKALYKKFSKVPQWQINAVFVEVCNFNINDAQLILDLRINHNYYKTSKGSSFIEDITPLNLKVSCSITSEESCPNKSSKHSRSTHEPASDNVIILDNIPKDVLVGFFGDKFSKPKKAQHKLCTLDSSKALVANNIKTSSPKLRILSNILISSPRHLSHLQSSCNTTTISKVSPDSTTPNLSTSKNLENNHLPNNNKDLNKIQDNSTKHKLCLDLLSNQSSVNNLVVQNKTNNSKNKVLETETSETSTTIKTTKIQISSTWCTNIIPSSTKAALQTISSETTSPKIFNDDFSLNKNKSGQEDFTNSFAKLTQSKKTEIFRNRRFPKKDEKTDEEKVETITQKVAYMRLFKKCKTRTNLKKNLCSKNSLTNKKRIKRSINLEKNKSKNAFLTKFKQALKTIKGVLNRNNASPCACLTKFIKYFNMIKKFRYNMDALQLLLPHIYPLIACINKKCLHNSKLSIEKITSIYQFLDENTVNSIINKQNLINQNTLKDDNPCIYTTMSKFSDMDDHQLSNSTKHSANAATENPVSVSIPEDSLFSNAHLTQEYPNSDLPTDSLYVNPAIITTSSSINDGNMHTEPINSVTSSFQPQLLPPFNTLKKLGSSITIPELNNDQKNTNQIMIPADPPTNFSYFQPSTTQEITINVPLKESEVNQSLLVRGSENADVSCRTSETENQQNNLNILLQNLYINNPRYWEQHNNNNLPLTNAPSELNRDKSTLQNDRQREPLENFQNKVASPLAAININSENINISKPPKENLESHTNQPILPAISISMKNVPSFEESKKQNDVGLRSTAPTIINCPSQQQTESSKSKNLSQAALKNSIHTDDAAPSAYISNLQALAGQQVIQNLSALHVFATPEPPLYTNQPNNTLFNQIQNKATAVQQHLVGKQGINLIPSLEKCKPACSHQQANIHSHNCLEYIQSFKGLPLLRTVPDEFENCLQNRIPQELARKHVVGLPPDEIMVKKGVCQNQNTCNNNINNRNFNSTIFHGYQAEADQIPASYYTMPPSQIINKMPNNDLMLNNGQPVSAANFSGSNNIATEYGYSLVSQIPTSTLICNNSNESCKICYPNHNNLRLPPISQLRKNRHLPNKNDGVILSAYSNYTNKPSYLLESKSKTKEGNTYTHETNILPNNYFCNKNVSALGIADLIPPNLPQFHKKINQYLTSNPKSISIQMHNIDNTENSLQSKPEKNSNRYATNVPSLPVSGPNPSANNTTKLYSENNPKQIAKNSQQNIKKTNISKIKKGNIDIGSQMIQKGYSNALEVSNKTTNNAQLESGYTQKVPIATNLDLLNINTLAGPSTSYTKVDNPTESFVEDSIEKMCYNQENGVIDMYMTQHNDDLNNLNGQQEISDSNSIINLLPEEFPSNNCLNDSGTANKTMDKPGSAGNIGQVSYMNLNKLLYNPLTLPTAEEKIVGQKE